jgi:gliding motility-associated-like protein
MARWFHIYSVIGLLFLYSTSFSFTLNVTQTDETCNGNGTIGFTASSADPNGSIQYLVYKLPNTSIPIASLTTNLLSGLPAGDYRVIAKETVAGVVTTQQQDVTIANLAVPLIYTVQSLNQACSTTSNISVTATSGVAVSYEIITGPMTFPLQSSNTFAGLSVGVYKVRVFDNCGIGIVQTFTVTLVTAGISISAPVFSNTIPVSCNSTVVTNTITPAVGTVIGYPIAIQYTIHPPGGAPDIIINSNLNSGSPLSQNVSVTMPYYLNQNYTYDMAVTDACGTIISNNFIANPAISLSQTVIPLDCDQDYFTLTATNFTPPYTLTFNSYPSGFNPSVSNAAYPNFSSASEDFGNLSSPTPLGAYDVTITDACGRTGNLVFTINSIPPTPTFSAYNNGCLSNSGKITITIPNYQIATAIISVAPAGYPFALPHDVSSFIVNGVMTLPTVPLGSYIFLLTDTCADPLMPLTVNVPNPVNKIPIYKVKEGCDIARGSIEIISANGKLTSVIVTAAPASFPHVLPFDVSSYIISNGNFYINDLTAGNYTFNLIDICSYNNTVNPVVVGYSKSYSPIVINPNCGSFDLPINVTSNGTNETFWLQKLLNAATNTWGNPAAVTPYLATDFYNNGDLPTVANSFLLTNNSNNYNITFNGTFRVLHSFGSFNNGTDFNFGIVTTVDKICNEVLVSNLSYNQALEITDAYRQPCSPSGSLDVVIIANGSIPLHYTIVKKDGNPFFLDNLNSNVFLNLSPAVYLFQVEDVCGGIRSRPFDVSALSSLVNITKPCDLLNCTTNVFDLATQNTIILGSQSPTDYTIKYYTSQSDAQTATNPITNISSFVPATSTQTIYVRLFFNQLPNCYETTTFDLFVGTIPKLNLVNNYQNCTQSPVLLDASVGNLATTTYLWSDGTTNGTNLVSQIGVTNLTVTATNTYGACNLTCTNTQNITVTISELPTIDHIETQDWTNDQNSITIVSVNPSAFDYSLDDINYQTENSFSGLYSGLYTVYIKDKNGCGTLEQEVWLLDYPRFFTPNDDGFNDTWFIKNSNYEPNFKVDVFDRFGKLITEFSSKSNGWDGNFTGSQMPATDYWFVVFRQDGRIHKGHFALKR